MKPTVRRRAPSRSIEMLETRIAPASLITIDYDPATGVLKVDGDDEESSLFIYATAPGMHRIEGDFATPLSTGAPFLDIGKLTSIELNAGGGADYWTLSNLTGLKSLTFNGGAGADELVVENVRVAGAFVFNGGTGADSLFMRGLTATVTGNVQINDPDAVSAHLDADKVVIGGSLLVTSGAAVAHVSARGEGTVVIARGIQADAGTFPVELSFAPRLSLTVGKLPSGESVLINGSGGSDLLAFQRGNVTLASGIRMLGFDGANQIFFGDNTRVVKVGKLSTGASIELTSGIDDTTLAINSMSFTAAGGISFLASDGRNELQLTSPSGRIALGKLPTGESIRYEGGGATDEITLDAATLLLRGGVSITAGGGANVLEMIRPNGTAKIGKLPNGASVLFIGGSSEDTFAMEYASAVLAGGIEFAGGEGVNTLELDGAAARVTIGKLAPARFRPGGESILFTGGSGNDSIESEVASLILAGGINFEGGNGENLVGLNGNNGLVSVGKLPGGQSVAYSGGTGSDTLRSNQAIVRFAGGIEFTGGNGTNEIRINNETRLAVGVLPTGESVNFTGGINIDRLMLGGPSMGLRGGVVLDGGAGNDRIEIEGTVKIGKSAAGASIQFDGGDGNDRLEFTGISTLAGALNYTGGLEGDSMFINSGATTTVNGPVFIDAGAGNDSFEIIARVLKWNSSFTLLGGDGADLIYMYANGFIGGDVDIDLGTNAASDQGVFLLSNENRLRGLSLRGSLTVQSTGTATDALFLSNVAVAKDIVATFGDGNSFVTFANLTAGGFLTVNTAGGSDQVEIEYPLLEFNNTFGPSTFSKLVTIQTGEGDDFVRIGSSESSATGPFPDPTRARFLGGLALDGGAGNDTRNPIDVENDFPGGAPTGLDAFEIVEI